MKKYIILLISMAFIISCNNGRDPVPIAMDNSSTYRAENTSPTNTTNEKTAVVMEALDAGTYTYLRLKGDGKEFWAAITSRPVETGKTYYYKESLLMRDFESKQLKRTFDSVLFIEYFNEYPNTSGEFSPVSSPHDHTSTSKNENLSITYADDEISLQELFIKQDNYKGKQVRVRGKVVKISMNIMNRNWIHLQDGTSHEGRYDLTVTLNTPVNFELNDIVAFKGTLNLEKDFGAGYFYPVIMEDAEIISIQGE